MSEQDQLLAKMIAAVIDREGGHGKPVRVQASMSRRPEREQGRPDAAPQPTDGSGTATATVSVGEFEYEISVSRRPAGK